MIDFISFVYQLGLILGIVMSWTEHHSVLKALVHGLCSWAYIIYVRCWS